MQNLGKLYVLCVFSFGLVYGAGVKATVDTVEVFKGNPVTLRIKATGDNAVIPKILKVADAPVIGISKSTSRHMRIVNGSLESEKILTHAIQFVPEQNMTIPGYTVNIDGSEYHTNPIDIKVVTSQASSTQNTNLFSLQMKANKTKVMVGESFLVTVYFSLNDTVRLSQDVQYTPPRLSDFVVTDTVEQQAYKKGQYRVQEVRYILTATKEGNFTISPAQAKIGLPDKRRQDVFGFSFGTKWMQTFSNSLDIEVIPQIQESDLLGDFRIDARIDRQEVKANKPVNLIVKIEGKGNLEGFDFPKYEIDGVTIYSDEATIDTKVVDGALYSIYSKSFVFISDRDFVIPAQSFSMLTLKDKSLQQLTIPSYDITVKQDEHGVAIGSHTEQKPLVQTNISKDEPIQNIETKKQEGYETMGWWMLLIAFISGALSMYFVQLVPGLKARKRSPYNESEALKILYAHMSEDSEVEAMVRKLYAKKNGDTSVVIDKKELKKMVERFS